MKVFHCQNCQNTVFFENVNCTHCGHALAFLPDTCELAALDPEENDLWRSLAPKSKDRRYRLCANYLQHQVCNWAVPADCQDTLCTSCKLTQVLPNLKLPGGIEAWAKLETAKRRLVYSLLELKLPLLSRQQDPVKGLAFEFLSDQLAPAGPVLTGHDDGLITINVAEADDLEREKRRLQLHEPYRTLLGHFRHEVGHYYWDQLIKDDAERIEACRALFGDEREDYAAALQRHYREGAAAADWQLHYVSTYASSHPWEDWAETWAHYMHMVDSLETAAACGLKLDPRRKDEPVLEAPPSAEAARTQPFDQLIESWLALTYALNNLSRSLGQPDSYPFMLSPPAINKLRFVHDTLVQYQAGLQQVPAAAAKGRSKASKKPQTLAA
ncbi:zinc-binding metallopeptidase family protein [Hydrocarboniphaga sp.]|uniref:zinc-binding metallopeptidase family protein n=1 Tax=Hydrocarboniphaga sp. TaxID=2033016 RepID=UPI003D140410